MSTIQSSFADMMRITQEMNQRTSAKHKEQIKELIAFQKQQYEIQQAAQKQQYELQQAQQQEHNSTIRELINTNCRH